MSRRFDRMIAVVGVALAFGSAGVAIGAADDEPAAEAPGAAAEASTNDGDHGDHNADTTPAPDDLGLSELSNGHHADMEIKDLDAATQAELDDQLAVTREAAARFPTIADAKEAGYTRAGPYTPGLGIHYINPSPAGLNADGVMAREDLLNPLALIYDGLEDDAQLAGFMYYSMSSEKPEGFAGSNDFWHYHTDVCIKNNPDGSIDAPLGADREATAEQCAAFDGTLMNVTQHMVHVWTVPGYEVTDEHGGTFGEVNPALKCGDGTYYVMPEEEWVNHPLNFCKSELS